jgi:hypothetical protein
MLGKATPMRRSGLAGFKANPKNAEKIQVARPGRGIQ